MSKDHRRGWVFKIIYQQIIFFLWNLLYGDVFVFSLVSLSMRPSLSHPSVYEKTCGGKLTQFQKKERNNCAIKFHILTPYYLIVRWARGLQPTRRRLRVQQGLGREGGDQNSLDSPHRQTPLRPHQKRKSYRPWEYNGYISPFSLLEQLHSDVAMASPTPTSKDENVLVFDKDVLQNMLHIRKVVPHIWGNLS